MEEGVTLQENQVALVDRWKGNAKGAWGEDKHLDVKQTKVAGGVVVGEGVSVGDEQVSARAEDGAEASDIDWEEYPQFEKAVIACKKLLVVELFV